MTSVQEVTANPIIPCTLIFRKSAALSAMLPEKLIPKETWWTEVEENVTEKVIDDGDKNYEANWDSLFIYGQSVFVKTSKANWIHLHRS